MSDDTAVTATQNDAENTPQEAPESTVPDRESLDVLSQALLSAAAPKMDELKAIATKQAKVGDVGKLLTEAINESTNEDVVKRREAVNKANEAILRFTKEMEELVKPTLTIPTDEDLELMDSKYKVLASELKSFNDAFQVETSKVFEGLSLYDYLGEMPGRKRGAKAGQGTGSVRPRVSSIEYTADVNSEEYTKAEKGDKSTFSVLSQILKEATGEVITAGDFAEAWTSQNGKTTQEWADLPEVTTFVYSFGDSEGKTHEYKIRVTR